MDRLASIASKNLIVDYCLQIGAKKSKAPLNGGEPPFGPSFSLVGGYSTV